MTDILNIVVSYFQQLPWLELLAMLFSLAYVFLAAKSSLWCWPAAFFSTALYSYIFFDVMLLMDSALNAYYLLMALYGYWQWSSPSTADSEHPNDLAITSWAASVHYRACFALTLISLAVGFLVANYTPAHFPYLDTFTTVFAIFATYLVTQKVLENWLYWIVIDLASIYLYVEKDLIPTTILFVIFVFVAIFGYVKWYREFHNAHDSNEVVTNND